jgi:hypothetical protein
LRKLPYGYEIKGYFMCKEMPVIPVNRVVDKKRISRKYGGSTQGGGEAQGVADPKMLSYLNVLAYVCFA